VLLFDLEPDFIRRFPHADREFQGFPDRIVQRRKCSTRKCVEALVHYPPSNCVVSNWVASDMVRLIHMNDQQSGRPPGPCAARWPQTKDYRYRGLGTATTEREAAVGSSPFAAGRHIYAIPT